MQLFRSNTRVRSQWSGGGGLAVVVMMFLIPVSVWGEDAVVRGKIEYSKANRKSWDGLSLTVPFDQLKATLREQVNLPLPPLPAEFDQWDIPVRLAWVEEFMASIEGKKFLEQRKFLSGQAKVFDIKFDSEGRFVVYDVPVGIYGLAARLDRPIEKTDYVFELFAQIEVLEGVDEVSLPPLQIEITPLLKTGDPAPPFELASVSGAEKIKFDKFDGKFLLLNFWTTASPNVVEEQKMIQEMHTAIKQKYDLRLLSINVDGEQKVVNDFIETNKLAGAHGMTRGFEHPTLFNYGVRIFPSFWLVTGEGKIAMTPSEIGNLMQTGVDFTSIISDRISGKDRSLVPTRQSENQPSKN
ncbi:MAG: TlpA family protein disulfide reductase [Pirellulales bacterium]